MKKIWLILSIIIVIIGIFYANRFISNFLEERYVQKCYEESIHPYSLALAELNTTYCEETEFLEICQDQVNLIKSRRFTNILYCDELTDEKNQELCKLNPQTTNEDVCQFLEGNDKIFCESFFGKDVELCNKLPQDDGSFDECKLFYYLQQAFNSQNSESCESLENPEYHYICMSITDLRGNYDYREEVKETYCRHEYISKRRFW